MLTNGVSAEYVKVPGQNLFLMPAGLSFEEAAGIGITYATAWNSLVRRAGIRQGDTIVVHAAGSGAGTALIQVAKLYNATIVTTVGDDWKVPKAQELGAHVVVNHRKDDLVDTVKKLTGEGADIVVDHVGAVTFDKSLSCLRRGGRLVTFGVTSSDEVTMSLRRVFGKNITIHGVYVGPRSMMLELLRLFPHKLRTVVDSVFDFEDAQKAYEKLLSRQIFGKIVVRV